MAQRYRWFHSLGQKSGVQPWPNSPSPSMVVARQALYPAGPATVVRAFVDVGLQLTVAPGQDPPSYQWWSRFGAAFSVTVGLDPDADANVVYNTDDPQSILTGTVSLTGYSPENATHGTTVRLQSEPGLQSKGQRAAPAGGHGPVVSVNLEPIDPDGITSFLAYPNFQYYAWAYLRVLYAFPQT